MFRFVNVHSFQNGLMQLFQFVFLLMATQQQPTSTVHTAMYCSATTATAKRYTPSLQSEQVVGDMITPEPVSAEGEFSGHDRPDLVDILKIQFDPMSIQTRIKNAKQSHNLRDLCMLSLSVFMDARIVKVWMRISTQKQQPATIR